MLKDTLLFGVIIAAALAAIWVVLKIGDRMDAGARRDYLIHTKPMLDARIQWCYDQKGKARFDHRNDYQGCEIQK